MEMNSSGRGLCGGGYLDSFSTKAQVKNSPLWFRSHMYLVTPLKGQRRQRSGGVEAELMGGMLEPCRLPEGGAADLAICIALHIVEDGVIGHRPFHDFSLLYPISPLCATKKLTALLVISIVCKEAASFKRLRYGMIVRS